MAIKTNISNAALNKTVITNVRIICFIYMYSMNGLYYRYKQRVNLILKFSTTESPQPNHSYTHIL